MCLATGVREGEAAAVVGCAFHVSPGGTLLQAHHRPRNHCSCAIGHDADDRGFDSFCLGDMVVCPIVLNVRPIQATLVYGT